MLACACDFDGDTSASIAPMPDAPAGLDRVTDDVIALYTFDTGIAGEIADVSGFGEALDLAVVGAGNYQVTNEGWNLIGDTSIVSKVPAAKLVDEISATNAFSIEVWIRPGSTMQSGPARIVCLSDGPFASNFILAQGAKDGNTESIYNVRIRTASTPNGPLSVITGENVVTREWTHLVLTRNAEEATALYVNGQVTELLRAGVPTSEAGALDNWDAAFTLNLGNELLSNDSSRTWYGEYALLAIFRRDLDAAEVTQNFLAGR